MRQREKYVDSLLCLFSRINAPNHQFLLIGKFDFSCSHDFSLLGQGAGQPNNQTREGYVSLSKSI